MKKFYFAAALLISSLGLVFTHPRPYHYQIASDRNVHGKGKDNECMDYAIALSIKLAAKDIHGRLIYYRWHIRNTDTTGSHVFVLYHPNPENPDETWIVDNEIPHPQQVSGYKTNMELVYLLSGSDPKTTPVDVELQEGMNRLSFF